MFDFIITISFHDLIEAFLYKGIFLWNLKICESSLSSSKEDYQPSDKAHLLNNLTNQMIICHFKNLITNKNYHTPINILLIILMFNQIMITDTQKIYRSNRNNEKYDFLSPSKKFMKYSNFSKVIQMGRKNSINQAVLISSKVQQSSQPLSTLSSLSTLQQTQESPSHKISFSNDTPESILTNQQPVDNIYQLETDDFVFAQKFVTQVRNSVEQKQSTQLKQFQAPNFRQASQKNQNAIQNSLKSVQSNIMVPKIISGQISVPHSFRNTQDIYEKKVIQNLKFEGLILYHQIPLKLFQRQIFEIRGKLKSIAGIGGIYINLILRQADTGQRYSYAHFVKPEQSQFSFKINFSNLKGLFYLSFFPGYEGSAQPQIYEIIDQTYLENIKTTQIKPPKPQRFKVQVRQNKVLFSWIQNTKTPLNKLTFKQQNQTIEYLLSNFQTYFEVNEADFAFFKPGKVQARLSSAFADGIGFLNVVSQFSQSELISFEACQHQFTEYDSSFLELQDFKWRFNINQTLIINGKSLKQLKDQIIILNPNKSIESLRLNKQNSEKFIKPNVKISKLLKFQIPGVYIIEINRLTGGAALNRPVYVGQAYPILPDIFDLSKKTFEWKKMTKSQKPKLRNITQQIQLLLNLTNEKRRQFNVDPVSLDQTLGRLALKHTNDMIENNYFNHIDLQQRTPQQRAKQMGIQTKIGQNIAMNINLTQAHYKLCRSPIHLQNMVSSQWYSVGFGINVTQYGVFYVTQQFSTRNLNFYPFSQVQYDTLKRNIVSQIVRQNPEIQAENKQLSEALKELLWVGKTVNEEIGFKLASLGYSKFSVGYVKLIYTKNLIQKLSGKSYFNPKGSGYKFVSVALSTSQQDYLTITVVYT